jgi:hypothetical protein
MTANIRTVLSTDCVLVHCELTKQPKFSRALGVIKPTIKTSLRRRK